MNDETTLANTSTPSSSAVLSGTLVRVKKTKRIQYVAAEQAPAIGPQPAVRRPAKAARMLALAHHIQTAIDRGSVKDRADVARKLGLTRGRVTQLLDLTLLAPDIQGEVIGLEAVEWVEPVFERWLRKVVASADWREQLRAWRDRRQ